MLWMRPQPDAQYKYPLWARGKLSRHVYWKILISRACAVRATGGLGKLLKRFGGVPTSVTNLGSPYKRMEVVFVDIVDFRHSH